MARKEKLVRRLLSKPTDYTWDELKTLLLALNFEIVDGRGSRVKFRHEDTQIVITLHRPHPSNIVKQYVIKEIISKLKINDFL